MKMKLDEWQVPAVEGLKPCRMTALRNVVALFGRNGAGKSRVLRTVRDAHGKDCIFVGVSERNAYPTKQPWDQTPSQRRNVDDRLPNMITDHDVREHWPTALDNIVLEYVQTEHPRFNDSQRRTVAVNRFKSMQTFVHELTDLSIDVCDFEGSFCAGLGGRRLSPGALSEGQRELFLFAVRCFIQADSIKGRLFLIDEPETHLHPDALVKLIRQLQVTIGDDGQLWLATHSISLLSELDREHIWVVKNDEVLPQNSSHVCDALSELIGPPERLENLGRLAQEPAAWAAVRFASQCLFQPDTVGYRPGDPQHAQVFALLQNIMHHDEGGSNTANPPHINILDIGGGQGRLPICIAREHSALNVRYMAVEPDRTIHDKLTASIEELRRVRPALVWEPGIATDIAELAGQGIKADVVTMINVLHEISPRDWQHVFASVASILCDNGIVILLEDQHLPRGELAHSSGFIILGPNEVALLFGHDNVCIMPHFELKYQHRLFAAAISKPGLLSISAERIRKAIELLRDCSLATIKQMRAQNGPRDSLLDGSKMAFLAAQLANSMLTLQDS